MENTNQEIKDKLLAKPQNAWEIMNTAETEKARRYGDAYAAFLNAAKTEREAVKIGAAMAEAAGYRPFTFDMKLEKGEKYYYNNRGKSLFVFDMGTDDAQPGIRITAAHVDAPRLDLKQRPLYGDAGMAYLKTHYYGGIKKYQWATIPLALHGTVIRADGTPVEICIGEDPADPVFYISDLLPHLGKDQMQKTMAEGLNAEQLNLISGSCSYPEEKGDDGVKLQFLSLLNEKYGLTEADLMSAELCAVPADKARFVGLDRSLIAGYGHDDRICAYTALTSMLDTPACGAPRMVIWADKEEIGSVGITGMRSAVLSDLIDAVAAARAFTPAQTRAASVCLSADVAAGYDPAFGEAYEKRNAAYIGRGIAMCKFTGSRGKSGASDASAELVGRIRALFDANGVVWQTSEMGKTDQGGGGTVAAYLADLNIEVLDVGVALLSMHAPLELASVADLYMTYRAFSAFFA